MRKLLSVLFSTLQGGVRGGLLLLALIISTSAIYASDTQVDGIWYDFNSIEELVDFSAQGYTNQQNVSSYQGNNFSVTFDKGTNSNEPKYFDKGTAIRVYGGGCFIVASEATITHIVIGFGSSDGSNVISTDIGTFSDDIWSGNSNSVKFMIGGTSGHRRIQKLTVITSGSTNTSVTYQGSTYDSYGGEYFGSVVIPETVTYNGTTYSVISIGNYAFSGCPSLTSVTIPNSVKSIRSGAFDGCSSLTSINVGSNNPNYSSVDGVLFNKDKTTLIQYPGGKQGAYTIPDSVTSIGSSAFAGSSSLTSVTIPNSVTSTGEWAFFGCSSLTSINVGSNNPNYSSVDGVLFNKDKTTLIQYPGGKQCAYTIPDSVTSIGSGAFYNCSVLTSIAIPNSVKSIGKRAFDGCSTLDKISVDATTPPTLGLNAFSSAPICYIPSGTLAAYEASDWASQVSEFVENPTRQQILYTSYNGNIVAPRNSYVFGANIVSNKYKDGQGVITFDGPVTSIGDHAFYNCYSLKSVTIPNSVTSIGYIPGGTLAAYEASDWASQVSEFVENPTRQQILYTSYNGNIVAPRNSYVFGANIVSNTYKDGQGIITFDGPVTSIGNSAFQYCDALTSITIPNSVTSIGDYAFKGCSSLTSVTIGESVTSIGERVFDGCFSLTSPLYNAHCFAYMPTSYSGAYTIPEGIEQIAGYAFYGCDALTSITIPNSVTSIGDYAFSYCSSLTSVTIPNSVTSIGDYAFSYCSSLTSVTIPNSVKSIGERAFDGCSTLDKISVDATTPPTLGLNAFSSAPICYILSGTLAAYEASDWASQVSEFVEDPTRQQILYTSYDGNIVAPDDSYAFGANIVSNTYKDGQGVITFDGPVTSIGDGAFEFCSSLTSITIPNSVTSIGNQAFQYCEALTSVTIGESVTSIGHMAFYACFSLTSVTIPNSVTSIGDAAFQSCSFTSITIPAGVTSIGDGTFNDCSSLTSVTIPNSVTTIGGYAFYGCTSLTSITIPNSVTSIGFWAFENCSSLTSVTIGESVTSIGEKAFYGCSSLTSITLPNSVTSIGEYAFFGCPSLTSITCEAETPPTLGSDAFYTVSKSIPIYVPCGCVKAYKAASGWNVFKNIQDPLAEYSISLIINDSNMGTAKVDKNTACGNQISATANYGYHFVRWSDGVTDNIRTLVLTQDTVLTAEFAPNKYTITTVSSDTQRGTTQGDTTVNYLEYITISATANYGYHFVRWNDGNSENPRQVKVTKDMTYTATFDKNIYNISLRSNNGTIESVTHAAYLDNVTMMANADYGYHFAQWSDGVTDNPRTFVITQDTTFIAEFAQTYSGKCGDNLYWGFANDTLTITGTGAMYDERPWGLFVDKIQKIALPAGITHIGNDAFQDCLGLHDIDLPYTLETIGDYSFNGCRRLITINCYPLLPPIAESTSFSNYSANLYAPCDNLDEYKYDMVFGQFKYFECIGSESVSTNGTVVTPGSTDVTITWPTDENADTYTIVIMKGDVIFCKLLFNKEGQLLNIAFAPGRDGQNRALYAAQTANGLRFTVTGLEEKTKYGYDVSAQDEENNTISSYTGEFTTQSTTAVDNITTNNASIQKVIRDGQLIIVRNGVEYNAMGQEM